MKSKQSKAIDKPPKVNISATKVANAILNQAATPDKAPREPLVDEETQIEKQSEIIADQKDQEPAQVVEEKLANSKPSPPTLHN